MVAAVSDDEQQRRWVSNADLQLELKALRSDTKLWILGAVALNQFLASVDLPSSVSVAALVGLAFKGGLAALLRGGGS